MSQSITDVTIISECTNIDESKKSRAVRDILNLVGDKWSIFLIFTLADGHLRFNEIMRRIEGISQRMLTRTLRELERNGLIWRRVLPMTPPRVEYGLTPLGETLLVPVIALIKWAKINVETIETAQKTFEAGEV